MKYLGNFGDVHPLDFHGFFVWQDAHATAWYALIATNWCDASGECENEQKVLIEEVLLDSYSLARKSWIDWEAIGDSVQQTPAELWKQPVMAFQLAVGHHGAQEFHPGGYDPLLPPRGMFFTSFKEAARFLKKQGVPGKDLKIR